MAQQIGVYALLLYIDCTARLYIFFCCSDLRCEQFSVNRVYYHSYHRCRLPKTKKKLISKQFYTRTKSTSRYDKLVLTICFFETVPFVSIGNFGRYILFMAITNEASNKNYFWYLYVNMVPIIKLSF